MSIIGCGVTGITAAMSIRKRDPNADISVFTDESHLYYARPRLYEVLSGQMQPEQIYSYPTGLYDQQKIRIELKRKVKAIHIAQKKLFFEDETAADYDKLLLANGAQPIRPPIKGSGKQGIFTLRTVEDAIAIREYSSKTRKAAVIGGGLLGLEFAACLGKLGQQVEVVEINPQLLPKQLDQEGSRFLENHLQKLGIRFVLNVKTMEIMGNEAVSGLALDNGQELMDNLVLIAAGIRSNLELAQNADIKTNRGVIVDEHMKTNAVDVYAAGDVAEFQGVVYGIIPPSIEQAKVASANILSAGEEVYDGTIPFTMLKIAGISLTSMGMVKATNSGYEEIRKVDLLKGTYKKLVLEEGKIVGAIFIGERKEIVGVKKLMDLRLDVSRYKDSLLENGFDYRRIAGSHSTEDKE